MLYFKKILKVLTVSLVVCVLLFSVVNASAITDPIITFNPIITGIYTLPPTTFTIFTYFPLWTPEPDDNSPVVNFADAQLRYALASELGVDNDDLTENYLSSITGVLDLSGYDIEQLSGIEHLDNIEGLILRDNPIYSRHQLKYLRFLTQLTYLDISMLSVTELPSELSQLTNLTILDISANRIDSLPSSFANLNLDALYCNYCFFDIADASFINTMTSATAAADYQYQLQKIDFYMTCQTSGTAVANWDEMPNILFPNGAIAEVQRYSISKPTTNGSQGAWLDSASRSATSFTFDGLDPNTQYSFDISVDYHIKNSPYDGKYIKFYSKELFKPYPQDTPTPTPTHTPVPTATLAPTEVPTATPAPATDAPTEQIITINPEQPANNEQQNNGSSNSMLTILLALVIVLIVAIIILIVVLFARMNKQTGNRNDNPPPRY